MGQRLFCEQLSQHHTDRQLIFAGFNALNQCEKRIFSYGVGWVEFIPHVQEFLLFPAVFFRVETSPETLNKLHLFYFWGNMLLGDFDDIDKYLVDAKDLFSNITALKEIESAFPYLTPEQVELILPQK